MVSVFDRGFLFGDGLYEGIRAFDGHVRALDRHVQRLSNGLHEIRLDWDATRLFDLVPQLLKANQLRDAFIYWQVTRGTPLPHQPARARVPEPGIAPTVMGFALPAPTLSDCRAPIAKTAMTVEDFRWRKGHIKAISLLGNVMTAMHAAENHQDDAIFVRGGLMGEGTSTNVVIHRQGRYVTPALHEVSILGGVTRDLLLHDDITIESRDVTVEELRTADEIMLIGTLTMVASIITLDGRAVGNGTIGPAAKALASSLIELIRTDQRAVSTT
jgi:D-alanine transaminase